MRGMNFLEHFAKRASSIQEELFDDFKKEAGQISSISAEMVGVLTDLARRGKRIRGSLVVLGYKCAGKEENTEIIKAGVAIDILHSALLVADDIIDKAELRRGKQTTHKYYEQLAEKYRQEKPQYFGISMAINTSLAAVFFAEHIFANINLGAEEILEAQSFLNRYLVGTAYGQGIDVALQKNPSATIDDVLKIHRLKTAYYTIAGPLQVGGILGGVKKEQMRAMEEFGLKVGIAFQLRDDELGMFGNEETMGKPADSDLKEGKNTVLFVKAFEKADKRQRKVLEKSFGNSKVRLKDLRDVRNIVRETGALKFSQDMCDQLLKEGKSHIPKISDDRYLQDTLYNLADFMIERGK